MHWTAELSLFGHVILAGFLGSVIGLERERFVGLAGIRTYATVSLGACLFGLISFHVAQPADISRIAAQIVSGIGFLGAGVIMRDKGRVRGLTTAATLWASASVGLAVANHMYILSIGTTLLIVGILALHRVPGWLSWKFEHQNNHLDD
ncbi:MAG: hypothetical protein SP1CHLAM54_05250 [Chlamydiia bacterium]|nr:hypothetical protein [Chlamydiia bacterium]MCH9615437.1 hypothetical protein [Chlamydiia bacterium]MCH9628241.1 hypothetical protein [Chlamydiia bacterium]